MLTPVVSTMGFYLHSKTRIMKKSDLIKNIPFNTYIVLQKIKFSESKKKDIFLLIGFDEKRNKYYAINCESIRRKYFEGTEKVFLTLF